MSDETQKGKLWFGEISKEIKESRYGVICITAQNRDARWLLWEAGALYGGFDRDQFVVPLLIDIQKADVPPPISHFQMVEATNKQEVTHWLKGMNKLLGDNAIEEELIDKYIGVFWQELQDAIAKALADHPAAAPKANASEPEKTFKDAAESLLLEVKGRSSYTRYQHSHRWLSPYLDDLPLSAIDENVLSTFKADRLSGNHRNPGQKKARRAMVGTVNKDIAFLKSVLNRAVKLRWLERAPHLTTIDGDIKFPHILSWAEQDAVLGYLPEYGRPAYEFAVNTGLRRDEIKNLRWNQLEPFPEGDTSMFVIPLGYRRKLKKVVVLNSIARRIIDAQRGKNDTFVFTNKHNKQYTLYGTKHWQNAWKRAGLPRNKLISLGVDNLRLTFEHRLSVAGVSQEDIDILRGSTKAEVFERRVPLAIQRLIECAEKITERREATIVQAHGVKSKLTPGKWVDRRRLPGRREKGKRVGEAAQPTPDPSTFELTGA
jgi:integrase